MGQPARRRPVPASPTVIDLPLQRLTSDVATTRWRAGSPITRPPRFPAATSALQVRDPHHGRDDAQPSNHTEKLKS
jgi:hypothetical protein